jgi:SAM-dependent methyltransferase
MVSIADSSAYFSRERVLPQHQAALTLLQARLSSPDGSRVRWLDLACGRGQIIAFLDSNLSPEARSSLEYSGFDISQQYARETRRTAESMGLASLDLKVGELQEFDKMYGPGERFDFITLTNTVHEVTPRRLASILVECVLRLSDNGNLFIYDMERIRPPELGAVPWKRDEVRAIVRTLLDSFGAFSYRPEVGLWNHATCTAWNVLLQRQYFGVTVDEATAQKAKAIDSISHLIAQLLTSKLEICRRSLDTLTLCGAETAEEEEEKVRLLFEFWAISRAIEDIR